MSSAYRNNKPFRRNDGFTLIEVMIVMFVLVLIGLLTTKGITEAAKLKDMLTTESTFSAEIRTSIGFIERDLNQVFNPRLFLPADHRALDPFNPTPQQPQTSPNPSAPKVRPLPTADDVNRATQGQAFQTTPFWGPVLDVTGIRASRFQGKDTEMSFVSASHQRIYAESRESIYAKVRYHLEKQPLGQNPLGVKESLFQLIKTVDTDAFNLTDNKESPSVKNYEVLTSIRKLRFFYFREGERESRTSWDSEEQSLKNQFPESIEMQFEVVGPKNRIFNSNIQFHLESPNDVLPRTY